MPEEPAGNRTGAAGILPLRLRGNAVPGAREHVRPQRHARLDLADRRVAHLLFAQPFLLAEPAAVLGDLEPGNAAHGAVGLRAVAGGMRVLDVEVLAQELLELLERDFLGGDGE